MRDVGRTKREKERENKRGKEEGIKEKRLSREGHGKGDRMSSFTLDSPSWGCYPDGITNRVCFQVFWFVR